MGGNALPCRAFIVNDYTEREKNMMYGLAWPSPHGNLARFQKHTSARSAQPQMQDDLENALIKDWARMCTFAIIKLIAASLVWVRLFLTLEVGKLFIC